MTKHPSHQPNLYTDDFYQPGHWLLKIRQSCFGLLGWGVTAIPLIMAYLIMTRTTITIMGHPIRLNVDPFTTSYLAIILLFCFGVAGVVSLTLVLIQNRKRNRIVEQWPTYDPLKAKHHEEVLEQYISNRFGDQSYRQSIRHYTVQPEQNLPTDELTTISKGTQLP